MKQLIEICDIENPDDWYQDMYIKHEGIFAKKPETKNNPMIGKLESRLLNFHPTGNYNDPLLSLPCTLEALKAFLEEHSMSDLLDEDALDSIRLILDESTIIEATSGFVPRNSVGKLTVKAAIQIEKESKRPATAKQVFELLKSWAEQGIEPSVLHGFDRKGVIWITSKQTEKKYSIEACQKTLGKWNMGRR